MQLGPTKLCAVGQDMEPARGPHVPASKLLVLLTGSFSQYVFHDCVVLGPIALLRPDSKSLIHPGFHEALDPCDMVAQS